MARGAWLPEVRFDPELRKELTGCLRGHDTPAIIAALEHVVQTVPVFRRTHRQQPIGRTLAALRAAAAELRQHLAALADDEEADDLVRNALATRGEDDAGTFRTRLIDQLDALDNALETTQTVTEPRETGQLMLKIDTGRVRGLHCTAFYRAAREL